MAIPCGGLISVGNGAESKARRTLDARATIKLSMFGRTANPAFATSRVNSPRPGFL